MKKFNIPCNFGGTVAPFTVYIGAPEDAHHPLHFQADWLSKDRGGQIPQEVMNSVSKLKDLAVRNNVSLEELCVYALGSAMAEEAEDHDEDYESDHEDNSNGMDIVTSSESNSQAANLDEVVISEDGLVAEGETMEGVDNSISADPLARDDIKNAAENISAAENIKPKRGRKPKAQKSDETI